MPHLGLSVNCQLGKGGNFTSPHNRLHDSTFIMIPCKFMETMAENKGAATGEVAEETGQETGVEDSLPSVLIAWASSCLL